MRRSRQRVARRLCRCEEKQNKACLRPAHPHTQPATLRRGQGHTPRPGRGGAGVASHTPGFRRDFATELVPGRRACFPPPKKNNASAFVPPHDGRPIRDAASRHYPRKVDHRPHTRVVDSRHRHASPHKGPPFFLSLFTRSPPNQASPSINPKPTHKKPTHQGDPPPGRRRPTRGRRAGRPARRDDGAGGGGRHGRGDGVHGVR